MSMRCDEFEAALERHAEGRWSQHDLAALREHASRCSSCAELDEGLRLLSRAFAAAPPPPPPHGLADRIVAAALAEHRGRLARRHALGWGAAALAATLLVGVLTWAVRATRRDADAPAPAIARSGEVSSDELLFPDLSGTDTREQPMVLQAARPLSDVVRAVAQSLGSPVRPITGATSQALQLLLDDLPDPDLSALPGMREMMPMPMQKDARTMRPSS